MSEIPVHLLVAVFDDQELAVQALDILKQAQIERQIMLDNAAVLHKDAHGKLQIKETADMGGGKGAALGGVAGAAIGLIAGSALLVPAEVGALVGGLSAQLRDSGFSDARLKKLGEGMLPGSSAILAVLEHHWLAEVEKAMAEVGADLFAEALSTEVAGQLEAGHKVAYSAIVMGQGFSSAQVIDGDGLIEGSQAVIYENGKCGEQFVATERGFAVVAINTNARSMHNPGLPSRLLYESGEEMEHPPALAE